MKNKLISFFLLISIFSSCNCAHESEEILSFTKAKETSLNFTDVKLKTNKSIATAYKSTVTVIQVFPRVLGFDLFGTYKEVRGSGVIVAEQSNNRLDILTCLHVASTLVGGRAEVMFEVGGRVVLLPVKIKSFDAGLDLAILETLEPWNGDDVIIDVASRSPARGDEAWVVGAPNDSIGNVTHGVISNKVMCGGVAINATCYRLDVSIFFGNSGGALLNSKGQLIGIVNAVEVRKAQSPSSPDGGVDITVPGGGSAIALEDITAFINQSL